MHFADTNGNASAKTQCWICGVYGKADDCCERSRKPLSRDCFSHRCSGPKEPMHNSLVTVPRSAEVPANAEQLSSVSAALASWASMPPLLHGQERVANQARVYAGDRGRTAVTHEIVAMQRYKTTARSLFVIKWKYWRLEHGQGRPNPPAHHRRGGQFI